MRPVVPTLNLRLGKLAAFCASLAWVGASFVASVEATPVPDELKNVGIKEKLGTTVPVQELKFRDETGTEVPLTKFFGQKKPVVLTLIYYECPNLCNFLLNGLNDTLKEMAWVPGQEFDIVTVSINPKEKPELATQKKTSYLQVLGKPQAGSGWHFLTGDEPQIKKLADSVGFEFKYDEKEKQYAHSAGLFVLTPEGRLSRILYGIAFNPKDLKLALLEASRGKIGNIVDRILLYCYRYNPQTRKYSVYLNNIMRAGAGATVLVFGSYLAVFWTRQRKQTRAKDSGGESSC